MDGGSTGEPNRLAAGGRLLDRATPLAFFYNGESLLGRRGDTVASALLALGRRELGRAPLSARPRGVTTSDAGEPSARIDVDAGAGMERDRPASQTPLRSGLKAFAPRPIVKGWRGRLGLGAAGAATERPLSLAAPFSFQVDVLVVGGGGR
ncbi:MAG: 2Fe-2S iron-sulfur cluster-binding protein, partial [Pseudomonadota bacterium]